MKYVVSATAYFIIDAPEVSEEDWENGMLSPIYDTFWELEKNGTLPEGEIYAIDCVEKDGE